MAKLWANSLTNLFEFFGSTKFLGIEKLLSWIKFGSGNGKKLFEFSLKFGSSISCLMYTVSVFGSRYSFLGFIVITLPSILILLTSTSLCFLFMWVLNAEAVLWFESSRNFEIFTCTFFEGWN